jgi:hypothetical protein
MIIPPEKSGRQNSAYRHLNMKGVFGNEGALHFLRRQIATPGICDAARETSNAKPLFPRNVTGGTLESPLRPSEDRERAGWERSYGPFPRFLDSNLQ